MPLIILKIKMNTLKYFLNSCIVLFLLTVSSVSYAQLVAPVLHCVNVNPDGTVQLTWTSTNTCGTEIFNIYSAEDIAGPYTQIETNFTGTTFTDASVSVTTNTLYYYIEEVCLAGGVSPASDIIDTDFPVAPVILTVDVLSDMITLINWEESISPEAFGYIIYREDVNGNLVPIDTIFGGDSDFYHDVDAAAHLHPEAYRIAAFDSCSIEPGPDNGVTHRTIHLTADTDSCDNIIDLQWTFYEGWDDGVKEYIISGGDDPMSLLPLDTVSSNATSYSDTLQVVTSRCYTVTAVRNSMGVESMSNTICIDINTDKSPQFIYLKNLTVLSNNEVELTWNIDETGEVYSLNIMRGVDSLSLESIKVFPPTTVITPQMTGSDNEANTGQFSFAYQIKHIDICERERGSNVGRTILLEGRDRFDFTNGLDWTPFELTYGTVLNYNIHRSLNDNSNYEVYTNVSADTFTFIDPVVEQGQSVSNYCYRIEAVYQMDCPDGTTEILSSLSNEVCVPQSSRIYVPNAFVPNGVNSEFKPHFVFPNPDNYSMKIFNRWGEILFVSTDPDTGWDGTYKGEVAPQGAYAYVIRMRASAGNLVERKGTVVLVR